MDRQVSDSLTDFNVEEVRHIIEGKLDNLPPISSRVVRVFICSTFSDMVHERNILMEHAYPKLKEFCRNKYGLEFQIVDLRWGIQEEAEDDHTMVDFCLKEIHNCQQTSVGPSFVALLGQKYGYRPVPAKIPADEFKILRSALVAEGRDVEMIDRWYRCDENVIPAVYLLQPVSSILQHYCDKSNPDKQKKDIQTWQVIQWSLIQSLREAASICAQREQISPKNKDKFFVSVTEMELDQGMFANGHPSRSCMYFRRTIEDLEKNLAHPRVQNFLDVNETREIDKEANSLLVQLRHQKITNSEFNSCEMDSFHLCWRETERDPNENAEYLQKFMDAFVNKMSKQIESSMENMKNMVRDSLVIEIIQHLLLCRSRCEVFQGRDGTIARIQSYICSECEKGQRKPLIIYGQSGCGKTSVLAKAAMSSHSWMPDQQAVVVLRFLGTSARSSSVRLTLGSICWQIAAAYGCSLNDIPTDYRSLVSYFHKLMEVATQEKPLLIYVDSIDQLSTSHNAPNLAWFPSSLPSHVRLVISFLPDEYKLLKKIKSMMPDENQYVQINPLGQDCCMQILQIWMQRTNRCLTDYQLAIVSSALDQCNLPLYTKIVFDEVSCWHSYDAVDFCTLATTVKGVINKLFQKIERNHGKTFVTHALSYITASRNGLSDAELEDVLSMDENVLDNVFIHWVPPVRRIPPVSWPRLHNELSSYIVEREANGVLVYYWYHRQFIAVAKERYLSNPAFAQQIHSTLADFFIGTDGQKQNCGENISSSDPTDVTQQIVNQKISDERIASQPLILCRDHVGKPSYNLRKLVEMPYQLLKSNRIDDLKRLVLFNFEWLHTKLAGLSLQDVLSDFRLLDRASSITDPEIQLVFDTLRVGGSFVNRSPDSLGFDMSARLLPYYTEYPNIQKLVHECDTKGTRISALVPMLQCFEAPQTSLLYVLEDHSKFIIDVIFNEKSNEVISVARDGIVSFWDLENGERTKMVDISAVVPGSHTRLRNTRDGAFVICDSDTVGSPALVIDPQRGEIVRQIGEKSSPSSRRSAVANRLLLREKTIFNIETGAKVAHLDEFFKSLSYVSVAMTHNESLLIVGEGENIHVYDLETKFLLTTVPSRYTTSCIVISENNQHALIGYAVSCEFKIIDIFPKSDTFGMVIFDYEYPATAQKLNGGNPMFQELAEITLSNNNPFLVILNIKRSNLLLLDVNERRSHLMDTELLGASEDLFLYSSYFSSDDCYVVAAQANYLHVWETATGSLVTSIELHISFRYPLAASRKRNLVATGSNLETAIKIWNLDNLKLKSSMLMHVYNNPVDMITIAAMRHLIFVKTYYPFHSKWGYKYFENFGIDIWDLQLGTRGHYLPFGKYGILLQMEVSDDASMLALLVKNRAGHYVAIVDLERNVISGILPHPASSHIVVSPYWTHLASVTENEQTGIKMVKVVCLNTCRYALWMETICEPAFTSDGSCILTLSKDLETGFYVAVTTLNSISVEKDFDLDGVCVCVKQIPQHPTKCIVECLADPDDPKGLRNGKVVSTVDGHVMLEFSGISPAGLKQFSQDGKRVVDGSLNVFNTDTGNLIRTIKISGNSTKPIFTDMVKMTADGLFVVWYDSDLAIKAACISSGNIVANMCTHEKIVSLKTYCDGYVIAAGREDGRLLILKLQVDANPEFTFCSDANANQSFNSACSSNKWIPDSLIERRRWLLKGASSDSDDISDTDMDIDLLNDSADGQIFIGEPDSSMKVTGEIKDLKASQEIQDTLKSKAQVPHSVISSSRSVSIEDQQHHNRNRFSSVVSLSDFFSSDSDHRNSLADTDA